VSSWAGQKTHKVKKDKASFVEKMTEGSWGPNNAQSKNLKYGSDNTGRSVTLVLKAADRGVMRGSSKKGVT